MTKTIDAPTPPAAACLPVSKPACTCKHRFCTRRNHALVAVPLGLFVIVHFAIAATALSPAWYQVNVRRMHAAGSLLPVLEAVAIFLPLLAQFYFGLKLLYKSGLRFRSDKHHRGSPLRFFLQRVSAVVMLLFLLFHVATLHHWDLHWLRQATGDRVFACDGSVGLFDAQRAYESTAAGIAAFWGSGAEHALANGLIAAFYLVGIWSTCYHVANGTATAALAWGLTTTDRSRRTLNLLCGFGGTALVIAGTAAWYAFVRH